MSWWLKVTGDKEGRRERAGAGAGTKETLTLADRAQSRGRREQERAGFQRASSGSSGPGSDRETARPRGSTMTPASIYTQNTQPDAVYSATPRLNLPKSKCIRYLLEPTHPRGCICIAHSANSESLSRHSLFSTNCLRLSSARAFRGIVHGRPLVHHPTFMLEKEESTEPATHDFLRSSLSSASSAVDPGHDASSYIRTFSINTMASGPRPAPSTIFRSQASAPAKQVGAQAQAKGPRYRAFVLSRRSK